MRSLVRFGLTGILATTTHIIVFVGLIEWTGIRPVFATVPAFLFALLVSYLLNYQWTFAASGPHQAMLPKYALVSVTGLAVNLLITYVVVDMLSAAYLWALLLAIVTVPLLTFLLSKLWVFKS
jgi:putative flippase GtrA